jgi:predicted nucleic acid-binding protein
VILVDSSVIIARANVHDECHERAVWVMDDIDSGRWGAMVITDHIFAEVVTVSLLRRGIEHARTVGSALLLSADVRNVDDLAVPLAWELFRSQGRGRLSFCDCATIAVARIDGIGSLATFDRELARASGLEVLGAEGR